MAEKLFPTFVFKTNIKSIKKEYVFVSINNLQRVFYFILIHLNQFLKARNVAHLRAFILFYDFVTFSPKVSYSRVLLLMELQKADTQTNYLMEMILKMYKVKPICLPLDYV